ncbi:putative transport-related membrane protein [Pseudomonas fluorescens]|uniref:Putative transport-related membrane protein n=2 Tax=Pseudomonas fluorescens TaxID=294 RepID=A0A379IB47_PSEFL|nr:MFS transporter [Pseudomonas fluorescens]SUD30100.1 putative transport-related membrane protein [Pseudomonas fluorescens]
MRKLGFRLIPFLVLCYFIAYVDRVNIGFAALTMNQEIGLTASAFGFGATLFFVAYVLFEMPSNMAMERFGARRWIARIMITWGIVGFCSAFAVGPISYSVSRFLLGAAEAGFFPGVILYLSQCIPKAYMARIIAIFMVAIPLSNFIGSPLSALLLKLDGLADYSGWQWLLMLEAIPAIILGLLALKVLPNRPSEAKWLTQQEQDWLSGQLTQEQAARENATQKHPHSVSGVLKAVFTNKYIWVLSLIYMGSSATSNTLSLWMPQILKSFHLSDMQTGLLNMIPFGFAAAFMIFWGMRADKSGERIKATAIPLVITAVSFAATLFTDSLTITLVLLTFVLMGNYAIKGPFWALCSETLPPATLATGIAAINTLAHLGTGAMSSVIGVLRDQTGSFPMALMPLCALTATGSLLVFLIGKKNRRAAQIAAISS